MLVSLSSISILGAEGLAASQAPLADVVAVAMPDAAGLMSLIALFATSNTVLVILIVASRMLYGLACNNSLPGVCGIVGNRGTPYVSVLIVMFLALSGLLLGGVKTVALITDVGIFIVYIFVNAALIALRYRQPSIERPFRSPFSVGRFPVLAAFGIASSVLMLLQFDPILIVYAAAVVVAGLAIYKGFARLKDGGEKYSRLFRKSIFTSSPRYLLETVVQYPLAVSSIMSRMPAVVSPADSLPAAVSKMRRLGIGSVIVAQGRKPIGIITERDVVQRLGRDGTTKGKCKQIMSAPLVTVKPHTKVTEALALMKQHGIKRLPVLDNGKLAGIVTYTDIIKSGAPLNSADGKNLSRLPK
ncbi:MAG: amino acid permease [Candidatus Aenigmarchaeota archaeon]|nr:amino acid permease [Candidatus Aenigmarchaeota archaeon]